MPDDTKPSLHSYLHRLWHMFSRKPRNRQEVIAALRLAAKEKILDLDALGMIEGVLQVAEMRARDIMIPPAQMVVVEKDASPKEFLPIVIQSKHSRFPVIGENRDDVIGILLAKDLLRFNFDENEKFNIRPLLRPAAFIPESKRLNVLLREFRATHNHMAIVLDEYGGVAGLLTIEDVLEQIVGEIEDEYDLEDDIVNIKKMSANQYNVKALTTIADFNEFFHTHLSDEKFDTIGGLVLQKFGHLPNRGESIEIKKFHFKVLHADHRRIRLLRVTLKRKPRTKKNLSS